jgi:hypothetical protein
VISELHPTSATKAFRTEDYGFQMRDASFLGEMGLDEFRAAYERVSEACSVERIEAG